MFSLTGTVDVLFSNKFFGGSYSGEGFCLNKAYLFSKNPTNCTENFIFQNVRAVSVLEKSLSKLTKRAGFYVPNNFVSDKGRKLAIHDFLQIDPSTKRDCG